MSASLFFVAFATVFLAEILGDKALFTIGALVTRFRSAPVLLGIVPAFMVKMLVAVLLGDAITRVPASWIAGVSAITFLVTGVVIWFKRREEYRPIENTPPTFSPKTTLVAFGAIFFSEWADAGQISAALLAARYHAPLLIWSAATLALLAKGTLALALGMAARQYLPRNVARYGAFALCLAMTILAALRV